MKITLAENNEDQDVLDMLKALPKSVKGKVIITAIRGYMKTDVGRGVIEVLRKRSYNRTKYNENKRDERLRNEGGKEKSPLSVLGDF